MDPKLTSLIPSSAFLSRTLELQISGSGTHFTSSSTVDFGDAQITASEITAGGDNNLRLTVQVGMGARLGAHDVTVTSGSESTLIKAAFTVKTALQAEPVAQQPMTAQGGLYPYNLRNLDYRENPFDVITNPIISGFSIAYSSGGGGIRLEGVALIDALTPPGQLPITVLSKSPFGADLYYSTALGDSSLTTAVARTPTPLTNNTARTGESLPIKYADNLYKLTTGAANQLLILTYSGLGTALTSESIKLLTAIAPASGKFSQGVILPWSYDATAMTGLVIAELATAGDHYLATYADDFSGAANGYAYTITPKLTTLTTMSNAEPTTETPANPSLKINSLTGAVAASMGKLTGAADGDYLVFTASATGTVLFQITNSYPAGGYPYPVSTQLYSDAACTTMVGIAESTSPGKSLTLQIPVTSGMTYCAKFYIPFPTTTEIPYKLLIAP